VNAHGAIAAAGITERQLGFWIRQGYLTPHRYGRRREWSAGELRVALLMKRLTDAGLTAAVAATTAREAEALRKIYRLDHADPVPVDLGGGLQLTINPTSQEIAA
jgi:DNA-binding transcriptional MerR regulator